MHIYLAGIVQGSVIDKCIEWRKQVIEHYYNWKDSGERYRELYFLNPINGEKGFSDDGMKTSIPSKVVLEKDYNAIKKCDLFIANMNSFGVERPPIGTIMEIAFAYEFRKPIIMITKEDLYKNHPFVSNMVSWYFETVEDMLKEKAINSFYKAWKTSEI